MQRTTVGLIVLLALGVLVAPLASNAQQPAKMYRIGILRRAAHQAADFEAFREGLRALGYIEGQNLAIEQRYAEGVSERLTALAAELVRLQVDVIVVDGTLPAQAARTATTTIPIVFTTVGDPVAKGLVASLAQPGGTLTGLTSPNPEIVGKQLELLKEAVPGASRVAVLGNPDTYLVMGGLTLPILQETARALEVQLHVFGVREPQGFEDAFAAMTRWRAEALLILADGMFFSQRARLVALAAQSRLAAMYEAREFVEAGGLMSYGMSFPDVWRRAATYVAKLLKGAKPADLPVEQPMKFELVINRKSAQALGLTMPPHILFQANEVIQ
jgi:putative ABC transport system substrate-binding protein